MGFHHSHHSAHHRGHSVPYEAADFEGVCADGLGEVWVVGGFLGDDAGGCECELAAVAVGVAEQCWQALAHAGDFGALVEMGVHARHVGVEFGGKIWGIRLGGGAHAAGDLLNDAADFVVAGEHLHVEVHVGRADAHHPAAHHAAITAAVGETRSACGRFKDAAYDVPDAQNAACAED